MRLPSPPSPVLWFVVTCKFSLLVYNRIRVIRLTVFPPLVLLTVLVLYSIVPRLPSPSDRARKRKRSRCAAAGQRDDSFLTRIWTLNATQYHPIPHIGVDTRLHQDTIMDTHYCGLLLRIWWICSCSTRYSLLDCCRQAVMRCCVDWHE